MVAHTVQSESLPLATALAEEEAAQISKRGPLALVA